MCVGALWWSRSHLLLIFALFRRPAENLVACPVEDERQSRISDLAVSPKPFELESYRSLLGTNLADSNHDC
jgi:hypothetical protein